MWGHVCCAVGGKEHLRPYWQKYLGRAAVLVFVVDSSRADLFPTAKTHLQELVAQDPLLPLVVLANKQVRERGLHGIIDQDTVQPFIRHIWLALELFHQAKTGTWYFFSSLRRLCRGSK